MINDISKVLTYTVKLVISYKTSKQEIRNLSSDCFDRYFFSILRNGDFVWWIILFNIVIHAFYTKESVV